MYLTENLVDDPDDRIRYIALIRAMDTEWLAVKNEALQQKKSSKGRK